MLQIYFSQIKSAFLDRVPASSFKHLLPVGAAALLAVSCTSVAPPGASPVAHGPPGSNAPGDTAAGAPPSAPPPSTSAEDAVVTRAVRKALRDDPALNRASEHVSASLNKGTLTLSGSVPSDAARQAVIERAQKVPGVDRVQDNLQIQK